MIVLTTNINFNKDRTEKDFKIERITKVSQALGKRIVMILQLEKGDTEKLINDINCRMLVRFGAARILTPTDFIVVNKTY